MIRWSWQPVSQAHHSDGEKQALNGEAKHVCPQLYGLKSLSRASAPLSLKVSQYENEIFKSILKDTGP
jgi:hypothetical protein